MRLLLKLAYRYLRRRPGRTALTLAGVASSFLLFVCIESLAAGLDRALSGQDAARTLIVYRMNRYCPQTSFLPERYAKRVREIEGVESVLPVKVYLSNCRASLDVVAFQGAPADELLATRPIEVIAGDVERFKNQPQSALIGREFAARRGLGPGDSFRFGDISVDVAGVFRSRDSVNEGLILTHLEFLQRASSVNRLGTVTQLEVKVDQAENSGRIAREIDALFKSDEEPTDTRSQLQFLEDSTRELRELLAFARIFGLVCVAVVLVLVANTVLMSVQERRKDFGIYATIGFRAPHITGVVLIETLFLTLGGGLLGVVGALCAIHFSHLSLGVEGVIVTFDLSPMVFVRGALVALVAALLACLAPAWRAANTDPQLLLKGA
ncbi:MAG: ABC transporter substrate-binding protein [Planctomycetes bacterium]|nr:ABC transporter substrate-binding protein [Planctomycetota bacterium]MDP6424741.1 ABC transporter permease [Planctomycetota bacterium]